MAIDPLLKLLAQKEVAAKVAQYEADGTILGYQTVINPELAGCTNVSAFIEVKLTPERDGGFDRVAMRIAKFDQVDACYLMSGGYDLNVVVTGADLLEVARFVSEKLSTIEGVVSTATHFKLKTYKKNGLLYSVEQHEGRLSVAP